MSLILPRRFKAQPQYPAPVSKNPLTHGLVKLFTPASGGATPMGGITPIIGADGVGFRTTSSTAYYRADASRILSGSPQWSVVVGFSTTQSASSSGSALYCERGPSAGNILKVEGLGNSVPYLQMTVRNDAFSLAQFRGSSTVTNDGKFHIAAGVQYATNDRRLFIDGRLETSNSTTVANAYTESGVESRIGSDAADSTSYIAGPIYFVGLYNTALSPAEIAAIWDRRWNALVKAPSRKLWNVTTSSGVTGTLAYTNADDTLAASGSTAVVGTLAVTNANDTVSASGTAGAGSSQFASDSFTDTDGVTLQAHDANWNLHPSYANNILIASNRAQLSPTGSSSAYYHSATPSSADYSVSIDVYVASYSPNFNLIGVIGRASTSANTFYHARHSISNGWQLYRFSAGAVTQIGSTVAHVLTAGNTYRLTLDMSGSTIRLLVDGVETISGTDTGITSAGKAGLRAFNASSSDPGNINALHIDNFSADEVGGSSVTGTVAVTNQNDTLAARGSPVIVGTLATTNADDTLSASGSIGDAVSGTLAVTNANDTIAASGTTTVTGALAYTNAGDTLSASGSTTVTGTLAATNADDTVSASGTVESVTVTGTLDVVNADDTVAASGTTKILGYLAGTNSNDTLSAFGTVNNGITIEAALVTGIATAAGLKKPGIPANTPAWLKTTIEILIGRRGNKIAVPEFETLTFSATPTQAECEALYDYTNQVRTAVQDILTRLDS